MAFLHETGLAHLWTYVRSGDTIVIDIGEKYKISATSDVTFIETQLGDILDESDIERCHEDSIYPYEKHCCPD